MQCNEKRCRKEHNRVNQLPHCISANERREHLERRTRRARNGQTRTDRQVNQQREYLRKSRMHTPGQLGQPACTRDRNHANNRQTDRAERKSDKGQPRVSARLCTEIRRENQVSGAEKHRK